MPDRVITVLSSGDAPANIGDGGDGGRELHGLSGIPSRTAVSSMIEVAPTWAQKRNPNCPTTKRASFELLDGDIAAA